MTTQIVFETHSVSTDNESGIATGWLDGQLSEEGRLSGIRRPAGRVRALPEGRAARGACWSAFESQEGWLYELTGDAESTASRSEET